jgi:phosphonate transport system substrate-binding protein
MDARFKDTNGDLVADAPIKASEFVDPATLVFAYTPVEDPAVYAKVWDSFIAHLAKTTGKKVQFFPVQSNAAQLEAMRAGRLHVAGFNTGSNPIAVNCSGFVPFAMMASKDNRYGYEMEIITHPGSGIEKIEDLKGKRLAFTSETSNSGYKAPAALLRDKYKMVSGKDYTPVFSGKHDNSILGSGHCQLCQRSDGRPRRGQGGPDQGHLQVPNLPDDGVWARLQPQARTG